MKSVVLLEGGSYRGIYTAGVLDVFMENNIYTDCVVGVSAGALTGMCYVSKQPDRVKDVVYSYGLDSRYTLSINLNKEKYCLTRVCEQYFFSSRYWKKY